MMQIPISLNGLQQRQRAPVLFTWTEENLKWGCECEMNQEIQILLQILLFDVPVNSENQLFVFPLKLESGRFD